MSFVFGQLERVGHSDSEEVIDYEDGVEEEEITLGKQRVYIVHELIADKQYSLWTFSQKFVEQSQKLYVLQNPHEYVPYVVLWFRPVYSLQLAVRHIVKIISGFTLPSEIDNVINGFPYVTKYFKKYVSLNHAVYTGQLFNRETENDWSHTVITAVIGGLLEIMAINMREYNFPIIYPGVLEMMGDSSYLFSNISQVTELKPSWLQSREFKGEIDMINMNYSCIVCCLIFETHQELLDHVSDHSQFHCKPCDFRFNTYQELVAHSVTFCRNTWLARHCQVCQKTGTSCLCQESSFKIYEAIDSWLQGRKNNEVFNNYVFSYFVQYKSIKSGLEITGWEELNSLVEITSKPAISKQMIQAIMPNCFPDIIFLDGYFTIDNWKINQIDWNSVILNLKETFVEFEHSRYRLFQFCEKQLNTCIVEHCAVNLTIKHLQMHQVCPYARSFSSIEIPKMQLQVDEEEYLAHVIHHRVRVSQKKFCGYCNEEHKLDNNKISIAQILKHVKGHPNWEYPPLCPAPDCSLGFTNRAMYVGHMILNHCAGDKQVVRYLSICWCNEIVRKHEPGFMHGFEDIFLRDNKDKQGSVVKFAPKANGMYKCGNELHDPPILFNSQNDKDEHIKSCHFCPAFPCKFYAEFESELNKHFISEHESMLCSLCFKRFEDLEIHMLVHPQCGICHTRVVDGVALNKHEANCSSALLTQTAPVLESQNRVELGFLEAIEKLVDCAGLSPEETSIIRFNVKNFAAETISTKNRSRQDLISRRIDFSLFYDIPLFAKTQSTHLSKCLQTIGILTEENKFSADSSTALKDAICNFESLDMVLKNVDRHCQVALLNEQQAVLVLSLYLTSQIYDEISSYLGVTDIKLLKFAQIIAALQFLYIPLRLEVLEKLVVNYKINSRYESYLSFASRVTRHISLCARRHPESARAEYIENHRRAVFRGNLPTGLLEEVDRKESIYSRYTSSELLGIVVSYCENNMANYDQFDELSKYKVYGVKQPELNSGTLRKPKQKSVRKVSANPAEENRLVKQVSQAAPKITQQSEARLKCLKDLGVPLKQAEIVCFLCLGKHSKRSCTIYAPDSKLTLNPCILQIGGSDYVFGFHEKQSCRHGSRAQFGRKVSRKPLSVSQTSVSRKPGQGNADPRVFRPYRK